MEKFNEIRNKFETGFDSSNEATALHLAEPEYVNVGLDKSTRKKTPKKLRTKQLEILPRINENLCQNFSKLTTRQGENEVQSRGARDRRALTGEAGNASRRKVIVGDAGMNPIRDECASDAGRSRPNNSRVMRTNFGDTTAEIFREHSDSLGLSDPEPEYVNVPTNKATSYFLPENNPVSENSLSRNELFNSSKSFPEDEYVIDNSLYIDFLQRTEQLSKNYFSLDINNSLIAQKPLKKHELSHSKKNIGRNFSGPESIISESDPLRSKKKFKKLKKNQKKLQSANEDDEPIFAIITNYDANGSIQWETWRPDDVQFRKIQSKSQHETKLSKFLSNPFTFWSQSPKKEQEDLEEKDLKEEKIFSHR